MSDEPEPYKPEPYTDEQLAAAWVGGPPELTGPVVVADYDERWPALYRREAARLSDLLGERVLRLEHVGSTSVPGLAIDLVVASSSDEGAYLPVLEATGYRLVIREPGWHQHRVLKGPDTDVNLHVWSPGSPELERHLALRDWLRTHGDDRQLYARTKLS